MIGVIGGSGRLIGGVRVAMVDDEVRVVECGGAKWSGAERNGKIRGKERMQNTASIA